MFTCVWKHDTQENQFQTQRCIERAKKNFRSLSKSCNEIISQMNRHHQNSE